MRNQKLDQEVTFALAEAHVRDDHAEPALREGSIETIGSSWISDPFTFTLANRQGREHSERSGGFWPASFH
jgi:hypothetical protein